MLCQIGMDAQTGTVRGNIFDKETAEPIIYGTVYIEGSTLATTTDLNGFFTLNKIPVGEQTVMITYIGYDTLKTEVTIQDGGIVYKQLYLVPSSVTLDEINISGRREQRRTSVEISKVTVTPKQIKALPSAGGVPDIAQYLTVLPGVVSTGDQGGQLYIRGGSPVQNKVLLDGMTIYNPFHSLGFFSVFETEIIQSVEVLSGGFNAEHGGRISAIVDLKTRAGNKKRFGGLVGLNPFQANVILEGPIKKLKDDGGGSSSFILTGKHSFIDQTSKTLYSNLADSIGLPFQFTDIYGKINSTGANGSTFNAFGFNFNDAVSYENIADYKWDSYGGGANFTLIPNNSSMIVNGNINYSSYSTEFVEGEGTPRVSDIQGFNAGLNFSFFGNDSEVKYGFEVNGFRTNFEFVNFVGNTIEQFNNTTEISGFGKYKAKFGNLILEPSLRVQFYTSLSDISIEPRFGMKYNISDNFRFKFGAGLYSQNLISTANDRDVVNLFNGFLSGPENRVFKPNSTEPIDHRLQKSIQGVVGFELDLGKNIELTVEPYYKRFTQLFELNRNKLSITDPDFITETGEAYGIDLLYKYETKRSLIWITYSYGFVNRDDGEQVYPTTFDRRHNANVLASYSFGNKGSWEVSARWNLGSGFPFTLTQGFYGDNRFLDGIGTDVGTVNPQLGIIFSETRNGGRLPYYHRLDLSLKKTLKVSKYGEFQAIASVTNVYDRRNIFYFDRVRYSRVDQLPILPSLGVQLKF